MLSESNVEEFVSRYVSNGNVIAIGSGTHSESFLKKLAFLVQEKEWKVKVVPCSASLGILCADFHLPMTSLNDSEVDVGFEFADLVDEMYNYVKRDSTSLIRDKMIAQSADELIIIAEKKNWVPQLKGVTPVEISAFGWKRTITQLQNFGKAKLREMKGSPFKTESGHFLADVEMDEVFVPEELDGELKKIPGVIETGFFIGYADRVILHNKGIEVKSRLLNP
ncbi:MAG: ribose 5-phosphate isomerase A [Candidatus Diapherotrites archaeon]